MTDYLELAKRLRGSPNAYRIPNVALLHEAATALEQAHADLAAERKARSEVVWQVEHANELLRIGAAQLRLTRENDEAAERRLEEAERVLREIDSFWRDDYENEEIVAMFNPPSGAFFLNLLDAARAFLATGKKEG